MEPLCECGHYPSQHQYIVLACKIAGCSCRHFEEIEQ